MAAPLTIQCSALRTALAHSPRHRARSFLPFTKHSIRKQSLHRSSLTTMGLFGGLFGGGSEGGNGTRAAKRGCELAPATAPEGQEIATFAGGCFWGLELAYQRVPGVTHTSVGYTAGQTLNPTYEEVCSGRTGHAEAVQVYYVPGEASYEQLLDVFFQRVDPTTLNRQGNDMGTQYRSSIYYYNEAQKEAAQKAIDEVNKQLAAGTFRRVIGNKVVTTLEPAADYYVAEEYHQQYLSKGGRLGRAQSAAKGCNDPIRCYG